jgi:hypothetical protein
MVFPRTEKEKKMKSKQDWKKDMQKIRDWCDKIDMKYNSGKYNKKFKSD